MPFAFLAELQRRFTSLPSSSDASTIPAYGLQGSFSPTISSLMDTFNTSPPEDELDRAKGELAQVKDIMVQNVEQILSRGERIELLVDKTDNMAHQATAFRRGARTVRRQQFWRNGKIMALFVLVGFVSCTSPFKSFSASCSERLLTTKLDYSLSHVGVCMRRGFEMFQRSKGMILIACLDIITPKFQAAVYEASLRVRI